MLSVTQEMIKLYGLDKVPLGSMKVGRELAFDDFMASGKLPTTICYIESGHILYCGKIRTIERDDGNDSFMARFHNLFGMQGGMVVYEETSTAARLSTINFNRKRKTLKKIAEEQSGYIVFEPLPFETKKWTKSELVQELKMRF